MFRWILIAAGAVVWLFFSGFAVLAVADTLDSSVDSEPWWMAATAIAFALMWIGGGVAAAIGVLLDRRRKADRPG